jgi:3-hydroxyisobutyrate dehydrogenase
MRVGLIGVGKIGYPLFQNLIRQQLKINILMDPLNLKYFQRCMLFKPEKIDDFVQESDTIFSILPKSSITYELVSQINPRPQTKKKYWIDLCSSCPKDIQKINSVLTDVNIEYMDAPISGGPYEMITGKMSTVMSGPMTAYQKTYDLISSYNQNICYISNKVGTASAVKLANNTLLAANIISVAEVLTLLHNNNIDVDEALHFINSSSGRSFASSHRFPNYILNNKFKSGLSFESHQQDILTFLKDEHLTDTYFLKTLANIYSHPFNNFQDHTEIVKIVK